MVGGLFSIHAVRSGTNKPLCCRCMIVVIHATGISILESQFRESKNKAISLMFCMRLISLHCQKTAYGLVWNVTLLHPANPWGTRLSPPPPSPRVMDYVWTFAFIRGLKKDIYKRKISLLWVGRKGHNEQTTSFPMKWCVVWLSHFIYCGRQSGKENCNHQNDFLGKISTDDWRNHSVKIIFF